MRKTLTSWLVIALLSSAMIGCGADDGTQPAKKNSTNSTPKKSTEKPTEENAPPGQYEPGDEQ